MHRYDRGIWSLKVDQLCGIDFDVFLQNDRTLKGSFLGTKPSSCISFQHIATSDRWAESALVVKGP